jgi:hypothetical protein
LEEEEMGEHQVVLLLMDLTQYLMLRQQLEEVEVMMVLVVLETEDLEEVEEPQEGLIEMVEQVQLAKEVMVVRTEVLVFRLIHIHLVQEEEVALQV